MSDEELSSTQIFYFFYILMNRKTMVYALTWISALSFLSLGTSVFAGYELVCEGTPLATFQRTVKFQGGVMNQKLSDITWKGDASSRIVKEDEITPVGVEVADGLDQYLPQFGNLDQEEWEEGVMTYTLNGETVTLKQGTMLYWYHPVLKKLYTIKDIAEAKHEVIDQQTSIQKSEAGLVECFLKKDGKNLTSTSAESSKPTEKIEVETLKVDTPKVETSVVEEQHSSIVENTPVVAPAPVSVSVSSLAMMTYETDKKGYIAIKNQPLFILVRNFGLDFKKDRKALAEYFSIKNYVGSYAQNMKIKTELLKLITVR